MCIRDRDDTLQAARFKDYCPNGLQVEGRSEVGHIITCLLYTSQFHPEKSAEHGLRLYRNFVDWQP